jgi:hypothetical protein
MARKKYALDKKQRVSSPVTLKAMRPFAHDSSNTNRDEVSWTSLHNVTDKSQARRWDGINFDFDSLSYQDKMTLIAHTDNIGRVWKPDPKETKSILGKRFPKGPMFSKEEIDTIKTLSQTNFGEVWLHAAGLFTYQEAIEYIDEGSYLDFQLLHRPSKILLAYVAWHEKRDQAKDTPPFWIARSILSKEQPELKDAIDEDLMKVWGQTLKNEELNEQAQKAIKKGAVPDPTGRRWDPLNVDEVRERHAHATEVLRKVFVILQAGLEVSVDKKGTLADFYEGPVIKVLSHGGRVNIRIPKLIRDGQNDPYALPDWLGITPEEQHQPVGEKGVFPRAFGTHYMAISKDKADGSRGTFEEKGQQLAAVRGKLHPDVDLYGMNLAIGGIGNKDFNGDVILPDGAHGHMFIGFRKPTYEKDGALQIGIETTGPHAPSTVGYIHNMFSSEKTANPISSAGGLKTDKVGEGKDNPRTVDLARLGDNWLKKLEELQQLFRLGNDKDIKSLVGRRDNTWL